MTRLLARINEFRKRRFLKTLSEHMSDIPLSVDSVILNRWISEAIDSDGKYLVIVHIHGTFDSPDLHELWSRPAASWKHLKELLTFHEGATDSTVVRIIDLAPYKDTQGAATNRIM